MTDTEWADENPAPSKKLVPTWLWFCGGGCLLAVIAGVILVMWGVGKAKEFVDPDIQYAALEEVIELDGRPEEWEFIVAMPIPGMKMWTFAHDDGYALIIMDIAANQADEVKEQVMNPDFDGSFAGMGGRKDMELTQIDVQGRSIDMMTYYQEGGGSQSGQSGQAATLDITPEGDDGMVLLMLIRGGVGETITAEEAVDVLAPMHIGPNR